MVFRSNFIPIWMASQYVCIYICWKNAATHILIISYITNKNSTYKNINIQTYLSNHSNSFGGEALGPTSTWKNQVTSLITKSFFKPCSPVIGSLIFWQYQFLLRPSFPYRLQHLIRIGLLKFKPAVGSRLWVKVWLVGVVWFVEPKNCWLREADGDNDDDNDDDMRMIMIIIVGITEMPTKSMIIIMARTHLVIHDNNHW